MKLHLGILEAPYANGNATTVEVAQILEDKYHVLEVFATEQDAEIGNALARSAKDALEDLMSGMPVTQFALTFDAEREIETAFRIFLDRRELDNIVPGVPTEAAREGVNHRFAHPNAKSNSERPSFVDTGLYQASMRTWTED